MASQGLGSIGNISGEFVKKLIMMAAGGAAAGGAGAGAAGAGGGAGAGAGIGGGAGAGAGASIGAGSGLGSMFSLGGAEGAAGAAGAGISGGAGATSAMSSGAEAGQVSSGIDYDKIMQDAIDSEMQNAGSRKQGRNISSTGIPGGVGAVTYQPVSQDTGTSRLAGPQVSPGTTRTGPGGDQQRQSGLIEALLAALLRRNTANPAVQQPSLQQNNMGAMLADVLSRYMRPNQQVQ